MTAQVLITMDDLEVAVPLNAALEAERFTTAMVSAMDDTRSALRRNKPDLVVLTGAVHEPPALELVALAKDQEVFTLALLEATDDAESDRVASIGPTLALEKPVKTDDVVQTVRRLIDRHRLQRHTGISGQSAGVQEILVKIEQMAPVSSTVLIQGESGTGKELVAKAIHDLSPRRGKPFIAVNCAALPETLLESELFGHEKGAFTGAAERRLGRFELADQGTIFLDEIGEMTPSTQVRLLRVLENRTFFRLGGTQPIKVDVRVIAATNRNLRDLVSLGEFRDDLYYRLNVLNIYLPPLRERREDIPLLVRRFIREFSVQHERPFRGITAEAMQRLVSAPWPGNVRQLRNLIESMVVLAPGTEIRASDIPPDIFEGAPAVLPVLAGGALRELGGDQPQQLTFILRSLMDLRLQVEELRRRLDDQGGPVHVIEVTDAHRVVPLDADMEPTEVLYRSGMTMADVEKAAIDAALKEHKGNRRQAAQTLGIGERTLYRKIKEYHLE
jgi:DNA-binding NtrC family response regulator